MSQPPPSASSTIYWLKVSAKPDSGRASIHMRIPVQPGRKLVTMSRMTLRGITA